MAAPTVQPPFRGVDFYGADALLSADELALRTRVREWVDARLMPVIAQHYLDGTFPHHLVPELAALGCLGASIPVEYGGHGRSGTEYGLLMQEIERADSGIRSFCSVQSSLVMYPIWQFGTEAQKRRWLPPMARGEVIGCFGLTEPDYGSNPAGMIVTAVPDGDGWRLNGVKRWLSNGPSAHVGVIWAKTGALDDAKSIRGFLVPLDAPGVTVHAIHDKYSLRASESSWIEFRDVRLDAEALLPGSGGLKSPLMCLTQARYGIAWGAVGAAMCCYDEAVTYAKGRVMFGKPIAATQLQQAHLADMLTEITKAQLLVLQLGRLKDAGRMTPEQVSLAKRANVDMACTIARTARRMLGGNGILGGWHSMRHMANLESVHTYEGTHDMHGLILGQAITGHSAFA